MLRHLAIFVVLVAAASAPRAAWAQEATRLPVMSSLSISRLWFDRLQFNGFQSDRDGSGFLGGMGRVALPLHRDLYVGLGAEAWRRDVPPIVGGTGERVELVEFVSQALIAQAFLQVYPAGLKRGLFARVGAGVSRHELLQRSVTDLQKAWDVHPAVSAGVGYDLPIARSLFLTPALDYSRVLAGAPSTSFGVIRRGVGVGVGLTLR